MQLLLLAILITQLTTATETATELSFSVPAYTYKVKPTFGIQLQINCTNSRGVRVRAFKEGVNLLGENSIIQGETNYEVYIRLNVFYGIYYVRVEPKQFLSDLQKCYITQYSSYDGDRKIFTQYFYFLKGEDNSKPKIYFNQTQQNIKYNSRSPFIRNVTAYHISTQKKTPMPYNEYVQLPPGPKLLLVDYQLGNATSLNRHTITLYESPSLGRIYAAIFGSLAGVVILIVILICCCKKKPNQEPNHNDVPMQTVQNIYVNDPNISEHIICPICLENTCNKTLPCSHNFHINCITEWMKRNKQCPLCRTEQKSNL